MIIVFALELRIMIPRLSFAILIVNLYGLSKIYFAFYCFKLDYRVIAIK